MENRDHLPPRTTALQYAIGTLKHKIADYYRSRPHTGTDELELAERYLAEYCKVRNRSWRRKRTSLDFFKSKFGEIPATVLEPKHMVAFIQWRKESGVCSATINRDLTNVKHMIVYARELGIVRRNRISRVKRLPEIRKERQRPTDVQIDHLIKCVDVRIQPLLGFIRETGCCLEEG